MLPSIYGGRLEVFAADANGNLGHMYQTVQNGTWSAWSDLVQPPVKIVGAPAVFQNANGRLDVFARKAGGNLGHTWQVVPNGGWAPWTDLGAAIKSAPAVFQGANGCLKVFAADLDGYLGQIYQITPNENALGSPSSWLGWQGLGPQIVGDPAVFKNADGRLEIFAIGLNGSLGHMYETAPNGNWSAWSDLGAAIKSPPVVFSNADGRLEVYAIEPNGNLGHIYQMGPDSWSSWTELGVAIKGPPAVFQNADGRLALFVAGHGGILGQMSQTAPNMGWTGWSVLGPAITSAPAVFQNADGRLEVFAADHNGNLGHVSQTAPNGGWSAWSGLGPAITSAPAVFQNASQPIFGSNTNYFLTNIYGNSLPLIGVSVTIDIVDGIYDPDGWSFQLNAQSQPGHRCGFQQFIFNFSTDTAFKGISACIKNSPSSGTSRATATATQNMFVPPDGVLPSAYRLTISLQNDINGNITGATYVIVDDQDHTVASKTIQLLSDSTPPLTQLDLAPIVAFRLVLVAALNSNQTMLTTGKGTITYSASNVMIAVDPGAPLPAGFPPIAITEDSSNSVYGALPLSPSNTLTQYFSVSLPPGFEGDQEGFPV